MAIITLRQLLHRPAPGGPISANDPLPVRLYGPNGQPISQQTPLDVRDQQLRDFLGSVHDEESDALKVALSGRKAPDIVTVLNAVSVPPGGNTGSVVLPLDGCRKALLAVNCTTPWRLDTNSLWANVELGTGDHTYPNRMSNDQTPVTSINYPRVTVLGYRVGSPEAGFVSEAHALAAAELPANLRVVLHNRSSTETATVTMRLMRIW